MCVLNLLQCGIHVEGRNAESVTYGDGGVCNGQGGDLHGAGEAMANFANAPAVEEEHQTHGQCEPERYGRLNPHLNRH